MGRSVVGGGEKVLGADELDPDVAEVIVGVDERKEEVGGFGAAGGFGADTVVVDR